MEIQRRTDPEAVMSRPGYAPYRLTEREHDILMSYGIRSRWMRDGDLWCRDIIYLGREYRVWYRNRSCRYSQLVKAPIASDDRKRFATILTLDELCMMANSGEWAMDLDTMVEEMIE